jgi:hypothetical protein
VAPALRWSEFQLPKYLVGDTMLVLRADRGRRVGEMHHGSAYTTMRAVPPFTGQMAELRPAAAATYCFPLAS